MLLPDEKKGRFSLRFGPRRILLFGGLGAVIGRRQAEEGEEGKERQEGEGEERQEGVHPKAGM